MSLITAIDETSFTTGKYYDYDGFVITLDSGKSIKMGVSNGQSCCENWGYFMTNDDVSEFIGAQVLAVNIVDGCLNVEKAQDLYEGEAMFVNIETTKGTLQFTAYNEHNGYYSHEAVVISEFLTASESL